MSESYYYLEILKSLFEGKQRKNSRYSLRSFARFLDMDPGSVSRIFSLNKIPTLKSAEKLTQNLNLSFETEKQFFNSVMQANLDYKRLDEFELLQKYLQNFRRFRKVTVEEFQFCHSWVHEAVFVMLSKEKFCRDVELMQKELGLSYGEVHQVIRDLVRIGFVKEERGILYRIPEDLSFELIPDSHPQKVAKKQALLEMSRESLFNEDISLRNHSYLNFKMDLNRIDELKELFDEFFNEILEKYSGSEANDLYAFNIGALPLDELNNQKEMDQSILDHFLLTTDEEELEFIKNQDIFPDLQLPL